MKLRKTSIMLVLAILSVECSKEENSLDDKMNLLLDVYWHYPEVVGEIPATGYIFSAPMVFRKNKMVYIGGVESEWEFIENGKSLKIKYLNTNNFSKYEIIKLSKTEFQFKHYNKAGDFLIELNYRPR